VDGLWATKSEGVGLIDRAVSFQDFQPMSSRYLIVTDGRTDRRTDGQTDESNLITALCTSASRGKNRLFDTNILEMHFIQAELWQILCSNSPKFVTMATKV